ncbi:MAG TPA: hypothetical protein VJV96_08330 [Candidatus Angelobacter sp.]|nr:hypothetical protein [Candidatus Angelobacter sp.]
MHDSVDLENLGVPAVPVATTEFMTPARIQAGALGRPGFDAVYVEHPIQDQTPQQIAGRADAIIEQIIKRLVSTQK